MNRNDIKGLSALYSAEAKVGTEAIYILYIILYILGRRLSC